MTETTAQIPSIRREQDYDEALARIAMLIGSALATPEGDELSILATLVDSYEAKHFSIDAPKHLSF